MRDVLIDTAALLDLVLLFQRRHRRNRSIASSAAAALESLVLYENPRADGPSCHGIQEAGAATRFLRFYCDNQCESAVKEFQQLTRICTPIDFSADEVADFNRLAVASLGKWLAPISDPADLRAYELYDYLPYHLGEDPTAIECSVTNPSVADLELIEVHSPGESNATLRDAAVCLKERSHPTRAAWALPLLRFFYYQAIQETRLIHFVPHATKSTIAFGRESETVVYRRLLDYSEEARRAEYLGRASKLLGGMMLLVILPSFAEGLLKQTETWADLIARITALRQHPAVAAYRRSLCSFIELFERGQSLESVLPDAEQAHEQLQRDAAQLGNILGTNPKMRRIRIAIPFSATQDDSGSHRLQAFLLIHDLFAATGIAPIPGFSVP